MPLTENQAKNANRSRLVEAVNWNALASRALKPRFKGAKALLSPPPSSTLEDIAKSVKPAVKPRAVC